MDEISAIVRILDVEKENLSKFLGGSHQVEDGISYGEASAILSSPDTAELGYEGKNVEDQKDTMVALAGSIAGENKA